MHRAAETSVLVDLLVGQEFLLLILPMKDRVKDRTTYFHIEPLPSQKDTKKKRQKDKKTTKREKCMPKPYSGPPVYRASRTLWSSSSKGRKDPSLKNS